MYCSSCGKAVTPGLTFCNHCGFKLNSTKSEEKKSDLSSNPLISAIVSIFVIGFGCIVAILAIMKNLGFTDEFTGLVVLFSFITMLTIEGLFMWLLLKRNKTGWEMSDSTAERELPAKELYAAPVRELQEPKPFEPMPSVTEHTTRTLEHKTR